MWWRVKCLAMKRPREPVVLSDSDEHSEGGEEEKGSERMEAHEWEQDEDEEEEDVPVARGRAQSAQKGSSARGMPVVDPGAGIGTGAGAGASAGVGAGGAPVLDPRTALELEDEVQDIDARLHQIPGESAHSSLLVSSFRVHLTFGSLSYEIVCAPLYYAGLHRTLLYSIALYSTPLYSTVLLYCFGAQMRSRSCSRSRTGWSPGAPRS